jgi:hypothetical protein
VVWAVVEMEVQLEPMLQQILVVVEVVVLHTQTQDLLEEQVLPASSLSDT